MLAIALPMIISYGLWSVQNFIDRLYLLSYSEEALAASLSPGMMLWAAVCLPMGLAAYVNTFVAQYHGAGQDERIGVITWQGIWIALVATPCFLLTIPYCERLFLSFGHTPELSSMETEYFQGLAYGMGAIVLNSALASFYTGRGKTVIVMVANITASLLNVVLDYVLIFGELGAPELGVFGAGLATSIANCGSIVVLGCAMLRKDDIERYGLWRGLRFDWSLMLRLFRYGGPSGIPMLLEAAGFTALTLFIAKYDPIYSAATNLAFNVNAVAFVPMFGLGIAVSTLVGQNLTAGRTDLAERAVWTALILGLGYQILSAVLYLSVPELLLFAHEGVAGGDFEKTRELTIYLLRFVAAYCIFDAMQVIFVGALKGAGDTFFIMYVAGTVSTTMLLLGRYAEANWGWQAIGWWWILTVWIFTLGIVYLLRFLSGRWKTMRVIEPE